MNLADVPAGRHCNARTRAGTPCKKWGILPSGRCRNHGGKSYRGYASPRLVHGRHSTYFPFPFMRSYVEAHDRRQRRVGTLRAERLPHESEDTP